MEVADSGDKPPSALRNKDPVINNRPAFGSTGKSLSFEEKISTIIPSHDLFPIEEDAEKKTYWKRLAWWEPNVERNWTEFCSNTSIHGLQYFGYPKLHLFERFFWGFAFVVSCLCSAYLINVIWIKYRDSPIVVTFQSEETFVEQIPFPAVTICNMNKILKSKAKDYLRKAITGPSNSSETVDAWKKVHYLNHVCSTSNKPFSTLFGYTSTQGTVDPEIAKMAEEKISGFSSENDVAHVAAFLHEASQPCSEMLKLCLWRGKEYPCRELFRPIETNFGKCCTFNMVPQTLLHRFRNDSRDSPQDVIDWKQSLDATKDVGLDGLVYTDSEQERQKYPRRQRRAGKPSGLSFLVDPDLDEYFCTASDSIGFRLATHMSTEIPHISDYGLGVRPNSEHFISVSPQITLGDDALKSIDLSKRNCYMQDEHELKYYDYYAPRNCVDECIAELTYKSCGCVRYYMPRDNKRRICGVSQKDFTCAENIIKKYEVSGVKGLCKHCLSSCTEISYSPQATETPFRRRLDLWADDRNVSTAWAKNNISIIHVYFGPDRIYAKVRSQLFGWTDLVGMSVRFVKNSRLTEPLLILTAQFGGMMGLCMGFSGLSLIELIYFFSMRVWYRKRRKLQLKRERERRKALERDRGTVLAYLSLGHKTPRKNSIDSSWTNDSVKLKSTSESGNEAGDNNHTSSHDKKGEEAIRL